MVSIVAGSASSSTYQFTFDNMGRLIGMATQYAFLPGKSYSNTYTYDAGSNRKTAAFSADGSSNTYSYDSLNRLNSLTISWAGQFGFSYDTLSRLQQMTRPNAVNTNYSYDSLSRLLSVLHQSSTATLDGATYTYDNAGNRQTKLNALNGVTETYGYDNAYQLTQVQQGAATTEQYTYDAVGNRLTALGSVTFPPRTAHSRV